jgi:GTP-binding protein Era
MEDSNAPAGRSGFVAIIGRPSSGKSTLLNALCGAKVAITSKTPQTTKNKIRGILTRGADQIVFIDTPGYHDSDKKLNARLKELAAQSLEETDAVLYLIDPTRAPGKEEEMVAELAARAKGRLVACASKSDDPSADLSSARAFAAKALGEGTPFFEVSALEKEGLEPLLSALFGLLPPGPLYYPEDVYTDQEPEFRIAEIIREKAMAKTRDELPHAIFVEVEDARFEGEDRLEVRASVCVERESQKGMLIGKGGAVIKAIRLESEAELAEIFPYEVALDLAVKVRKNWKAEDRLIKKLYY